MVKRAKADVFYMSLQNHASGSLMAIQAKRIGLKAKILSQDAMYHPNFVKVAKKAAEGVYVTYGYTDKSTPAYKAYAKRFTAGYGEIGAYGTYAYDGAMALFKAIKMAKSTDPAKVKAALLKLDYQGASKQVNFKANGDSGSAYVAFKITDGEYKLYWTPEGGFLK